QPSQALQLRRTHAAAGGALGDPRFDRRQVSANRPAALHQVEVRLRAEEETVRHAAYRATFHDAMRHGTAAFATAFEECPQSRGHASCSCYVLHRVLGTSSNVAAR